MPNQVHEPEAELASAEDALADAARLSALLQRSRCSVAVRVPLWAIYEALDALETRELQEIAHHIQERLLLKRTA